MENAFALLGSLFVVLFSRVACFRCSGSGKLRGFSHVLRGVCFACEGAGTFKTYVVHKASRNEIESTQEGDFADNFDRIGETLYALKKTNCDHKSKVICYFWNDGHGVFYFDNGKAVSAPKVAEAVALAGVAQ
jgi:hypothetical protein